LITQIHAAEEPPLYVFETATPELLYNTVPTPAPNTEGVSKTKVKSGIMHHALDFREYRSLEERFAV
jgi:hypothetical protein